jgi:hypothetical protein
LLFSRQKATLEKIHESNPSLTGKLNRIIPWHHLFLNSVSIQKNVTDISTSEDKHCFSHFVCNSLKSTPDCVNNLAYLYETSISGLKKYRFHFYSFILCFSSKCYQHNQQSSISK